MTKRKIMTLAMALCMVAILAVGGTLAYFTDEDAKTNTFTVGNVDIHIDETMENEKGEEVPYEDHELHPVAQDKAPFNKMVYTVNDGSEDAYIRTYITCPADMYWYLGLGFNAGAGSEVVQVKDENGKVISQTYNITWKDVGVYKINGEDTSVFLCEVADKCPIVAGDQVLSLTKVWLYENVDNEEVEAFKLNEGAFKILVGSQAIQSEYLTYDEAMKQLGDDPTAVKQLFGENATLVSTTAPAKPY